AGGSPVRGHRRSRFLLRGSVSTEVTHGSPGCRVLAEDDPREPYHEAPRWPTSLTRLPPSGCARPCRCRVARAYTVQGPPGTTRLARCRRRSPGGALAKDEPPCPAPGRPRPAEADILGGPSRLSHRAAGPQVIVAHGCLRIADCRTRPDDRPRWAPP